ncbi:calcium-binding protein [Microvirga yunnanensis]|uniref:calcium-binding protein n=1 Tax=Microvirga yunnanensis TaxID=2953740 RepID=UPI0021C96A6F|nr:calcium-binding protein [Microvirga sp. HBU65207]
MAIRIGTPKDDRIDGTDFSDILDGGAGNDWLDGGVGSDTVYGGAGSDTAYFSADAAVTVDLGRNTAIGQGFDRLFGIENVVGSLYDDRLTGDRKANNLSGGYGNDRLMGAGGDDFLNGNVGNDTVVGGTGNDTVAGSSGNDHLYGSGGNDRLDGGEGRNTLEGGAGNDTLGSARGTDWMIGGSGADTFSFGPYSSGTTSALVSTIADWSVAADRIDLAIDGTASNYGEAATGATTVEAALLDAQSAFAGGTITHAFLYNIVANTGYVFSDQDEDGTFEIGIVMANAGTAAAMNYWNIV